MITFKKWNGSTWVEESPKVDTGTIVASGTPSSSTFLRGDGSWATPPNGGTLQDDLTLAKDGSTEVGSHGIVFQANTAGSDFLRELNIDKTGTLKFNGTAVSLAGHTHNYAGSASAGGPATSLANFITTTTSDLGVDVGTSGIGYISVSLLGQVDGALYTHVYSASWKHQIYGDYRTGQIAIRGKNNGTWQAWRTVVDSSNIGSYETSHADVVVDGDVSVSATANKIVQRDSNGYIYGTYINSNRGNETSTAQSYIYDSGDGWLRKKTVANAQTELVTSSAVTTALGYTPYNATNPNGYITSSGSITGNAATATKLASPATINGVNFDGSAGITVYDGSKLPIAGGTLTGNIAFSAPAGASADSRSITFTSRFNSADVVRALYVNPAGTLVFNGTAVSLSGHTHSYADLTGTVPTWNQSTTGNAATATTATTAGKWTSPITLTIGSSSQSLDGSGGLNYSLASIGAASTSHTHGDISNTGTITSTAVTPGSGDYILISDTSASGIIKRAISLGSSTTTFLRNDGTWQTGTGAVQSVNGYTGAVNTVNNTITTATVNSLVYGVLQGTAVVQTSSGRRLKIDTGFYNPQGGSTGNSITFNVSFAQRPAVFAFPVRASSSTATLVAAKATAVSTTGATFISSYISSTATYTPSNTNETYCWVAIGY